MSQHETPTQPLSEARKRQALHIGYVEMERIVEEVIVAEFTRIGELLMKHDYTVEVVVFDTESELDGKLYVCGAGLRANRGSMKNAIVFTGDPHSFNFVLQMQNFASKTSEETVEYHRLTPNWFHSKVKSFLSSSFREVDFSHIENSFSDDWQVMEGPFSIKIKNNYGYYNEVASAETIERAFQLSSYAAEEHYAEEDLIVTDKNGREVG
ncbi:MAG: hypothetical protein ACI9E1_000762 [Cryomorphaceae bacterium]|jgi:hypothetical protein